MFWCHDILQQLLEANKKQHLPHALLFLGNAGLGKKELAQQFSQFLLCSNPNANGNACYQCKNCQLFSAKTHSDFYFIFPEEGKSIGINQIRDIKINAYQTAHRGKMKIFLVDHAHDMTIAAANALLKILEEPPQDCLFILTSESKHALPATIISRCQYYQFSTDSSENAEAWLMLNTQNQYSIDLIRSALTWSCGAPFLAKALLEKNTVQPLEDFSLALNSYFARKISLFELRKVAQDKSLLDILHVIFLVCHLQLKQKTHNNKKAMYHCLDKVIEIKKRLASNIALNETLLLELLFQRL